MPEMFYTGKAIQLDPVLAASVAPDHRRRVSTRPVVRVIGHMVPG